MKPTVQIKDCFFVYGDRLSGTPIDYPEEHMAYAGAISNKRNVVTSKVIQQFCFQGAEYVETERTIYRVLNWAKDSANAIN